MPVNTLPVDSNSKPASGLFDPTTGHVIAAKSGTVATSSGGVEYAPAIMNIADPTTPANQLAVNNLGQIAISNFPSVQSIIGTVSIAQFPSIQPVTGSVDVTDRAARQLGHVIVDLGGAGTNTAPGYTIIQDGVLNTRKMTVNADGSINVSGTISASNPSVGTSGAAIPTSSTLLGASDGVNLQQLLVESAAQRNLRVALYQSGNEVTVTGANALKVDNSSVTQPVSGTVSVNALPAGASTIGNVGIVAGSATIGGVKLIDTGGTNVAAISAGGALKVDNSAVTQPVSGTITANAGTGTMNIAGTGSAGAAASGVVTVQGIASMTALKIDGSATTQPVSGTITANAGTGNFTVAQATGSNLHAVLDAGSALVGTVELADSGGTNKLSINSAGQAQIEDIEQANYVAASSPPSTTNAGSDTSYTFSSQVARVIIQNNTSANVNYAFDTAASAGSLVLVPGAMLVYPKKCTVLHLYTAAAQNVNGTSAGNVIVLGAL